MEKSRKVERVEYFLSEKVGKIERVGRCRVEVALKFLESSFLKSYVCPMVLYQHKHSNKNKTITKIEGTTHNADPQINFSIKILQLCILINKDKVDESIHIRNLKNTGKAIYPLEFQEKIKINPFHRHA